MATNAAVEHRLTELQQALLDIARNGDLRDQRTARALDRLTEQNDRTALGLDRLSAEMREFKDEMRVFKDEMGAFKDEMGEFKDETRTASAELRASMDRQNAELNASMDRQNSELKASMDRQNAELNASMDRQNAKLNASMDRQNAKLNASMDRQNAKLNASMDRQNAELAASLRQQNAKLSDAIGRLAEDIIGPSIPTLFKRFFGGDEPLYVMRVLKEHRTTGQRREFDTPAWNDRFFLFTETKSKLRPEDLKELSETLAEVRDYFPEAHGKKVCAALASLYIDPSLVTAGERRGFLMIALGNDLAEVMNSEGFVPAEF